MRLIADKPGGTRFVGDTEPLPVTIAGDVPFYPAGDVAYFTTELDPCAVRRAAAALGITNDFTTWPAIDASSPTFQMPNAKGIIMAKDGSLYYVDTTGNILATVPRNTLDEYTGTNPDVLALKKRTVPIQIRLDQYVPTVIHFYIQSSLGGTNASESQNQIGVALIGAAYPQTNNQDQPDLNNSRWYVLNINQGNYVLFSRIMIPDLPDRFGGLSPGTNASGVCYSIPFPALTPPMLANPPTEWWYILIRPGYVNQHSTAVRHPFVSLTVECEVIP